MLEKCLLVVCGVTVGAYLERRRWIKASVALLKGFGSAFATKNEEPETESETEKTDN